MPHLDRSSTPRCLLVALGATVALAALAALALPALASVRPAPGRTFDELLVGGCAAAGLATAAWLWAVTVLVALEARRGRPPRQATFAVPGAVRRLVLAACGVAVLASASPAAAHDQPHPLHGLPMPERATSTAAWVVAALSTAPGAQAAADQDEGRTTVVRPGDTLWQLAAADLSPTAGPAAVTRHWHRLHDLNRAVIGDDPDLIHPGQRLQLPPTPHGGASS